jgi:hypothetical protein
MNPHDPELQATAGAMVRGLTAWQREQLLDALDTPQDREQLLMLLALELGCPQRR